MEKTPSQPKSNTKYRAIVIGLIIFAAVVFLDPFGWFTPPSVFRPAVNPQEAQAFSEAILNQAVDAEQYLIQKLNANKIVFLSELGGLSEEPRFLARVLPRAVDEGGITTLSVYFLLAADQNKIDQLLAGSSFDEELAKQLLFNRLPLWGYQEYLEILQAGWLVRQRSSDTAQNFRILGLNITQDYSQIKSEEDMKDAAKVRTIIESGIPDQAMADTLITYLKEEPQARVLAYTTREQAMPQLDLRLYSEQMEGLGHPDQNQFARIVFNQGYHDVSHITFHSPWPTNNTQNRSQYPAEGTVDAGMDLLQQQGELPDFPFAVPIDGTTFASVEISDTIYAYGFGEDGEEPLEFKDIADGFIVLERLHKLNGATPIPNFVTLENFEQAKANFPGPISSDIRVQDFETFISRYAENRGNILSDMK